MSMNVSNTSLWEVFIKQLREIIDELAI